MVKVSSELSPAEEAMMMLQLVSRYQQPLRWHLRTLLIVGPL